MSWFKRSPVRGAQPDHVLTDEAVLHAVNLGAIVHNLLGAYEQAMVSDDYERFSRKLYDLSVYFHRPEAAEARENMRQEWVKRCVRDGLPLVRRLD